MDYLVCLFVVFNVIYCIYKMMVDFTDQVAKMASPETPAACGGLDSGRYAAPITEK